MNIGIVTTWFERGAAYVSRQFMDILQKTDSVFIYARGGEKFAKGDPKWDLSNVHWSSYPFNSNYINKSEFQSWMRTNGIEIVIFNEQHNFTPVLWCKEIGVKTVAYIDYYTEQTIPFFNIYDAIICNTKRHLSAFEHHPRVFFLPWGTDNDVYKPSDDEGNLVEKGKVVFFNSAGMAPHRKGTDTFLQALMKCRDRGNIKALIHSQKDLRKTLPELATTIDKLEKEGVLVLVEKTIPAPGLYYKADVYVYPSVLDGIGLTVPEAVSSGLACIVSNNPPMNEFIDDSCGSLIPITRLFARPDGYYWPQCRCDVDALADMLQDYAKNLEKVISMKKRARLYALSHLSFEKNAQNLSSLLESVQLTAVDDGLEKKISAFDQRNVRMLNRLIVKYKLFKLPISKLRKMVDYQGY